MSIYEQLSQERKKGQKEGTIPTWASTASWQMMKGKTLHQPTWKDQVKLIAKTAAQHAPDPEVWEKKFFDLIWNGWLSLASPIIANMGTNRGMVVSCSGNVVEDSIEGFYNAAREIAILSKWGFGTSAYIGDIRPRGSKISRGGKADGKLPVMNMLTQVTKDTSQGAQRRGSGAWYVSIEDKDFPELLGQLESNPDDLNIGWIITDAFIEKMNAGDEASITRWQQAMRVKMTLGKGYFFFVDKANRHRPQMYKDLGLDVKASNLCTEIMLHSSKDYTFSCILSSMVVARYDEWKDTDAVFVATVFLDCVASEFIKQSEGIPGLEKVRDFTIKGRAIGLGQMGLFSLFQKRLLDAESFEAHMLSNEVAKHIHDESLRASQWLAKELGEPEWCKGFGVRATHLTAIAPTKSSSILMGGWSEGINPDPKMAFSASGAAGDIDRFNPVLLDLIKKKGLNVDACMDEVRLSKGSVQGVSWLSDVEKKAFKTAFEIDQMALIRMASSRQRWICQGQSLNLFFAKNDGQDYISKVHQAAFEDENILSLYYVYSDKDVKAERTGECVACEG